MNFVAIDFETGFTGAGGICEVGVAVVSDGVVQEHRSWLVQPLNNQMNDRHVDVTQITADMTAKAPPFPDIWNEIYPYFDGQRIVAHNAKSTEVSLLGKTLALYELPYPNCTFYCSLAAAKRVLKQKSYGLRNLCNELGIRQERYHRAEDDAIACAELFLQIIQIWKQSALGESGELPHWSSWFEPIEFAHWNRNPAGSNGARPKHHKASSARKQDPLPLPHREISQLIGKTICITGATHYSRRQIEELLNDLGAIPTPRVTQNTDILIVGDAAYDEYRSTGCASKKLAHALKLNLSGKRIEIVKESELFKI